MDKFEETVVNPNLSLKNFEVKVPDEQDSPVIITTNKQHGKTKRTNSRKSIFLLVILAVLLVYQFIVGL